MNVPSLVGRFWLWTRGAGPSSIWCLSRPPPRESGCSSRTCGRRTRERAAPSQPDVMLNSAVRRRSADPLLSPSVTRPTHQMEQHQPKGSVWSAVQRDHRKCCMTVWIRLRKTVSKSRCHGVTYLVTKGVILNLWRDPPRLAWQDQPGPVQTESNRIMKKVQRPSRSHWGNVHEL